MPFCKKTETKLLKHFFFFSCFFCLCFPMLSSRMSRNMCKLCLKLQNAKKCVGQMKLDKYRGYTNVSKFSFTFLE